MTLRRASILPIIVAALTMLRAAASVSAQENPPVLGHEAPARVAPEAAGKAATPVVTSTPPQAAVEGMIERGGYLVKIGGCNDCHTPLKEGPNGPEPDMDRMLSGHPANLKMPPPPRLPPGPWTSLGAVTSTAFAGPWGVSYGSNLTPDEDTGMGAWSEQIFVEAMRTGRHFGVARPILPPMPWQNLARLNDSDLRSVYRYLTNIPPISNRVPEAELTANK